VNKRLTTCSLSWICGGQKPMLRCPKCLFLALFSHLFFPPVSRLSNVALKIDPSFLTIVRSRVCNISECMPPCFPVVETIYLSLIADRLQMSVNAPNVMVV
jgi:hypothetical protein